MGVKNFPDFYRKVGEVSAVQPHAVSVWIAVVDPVIPEGPDGIENAAVEGVVGVDQENQVLSPVGVDVVVECPVLSLHGAAV